MDSGFVPKILVCVECGEEFVFTVNAQEYFAERGYNEEPKRCKHCYMQHKRDKRATLLEDNRVDIGALYPE
jgi:hypothetical protein